MEIFTLNRPENINIEIINDQIVISWDLVDDATSYKVYSSDNPYSGFYEDFSGIYDGKRILPPFFSYFPKKFDKN